MKTAAIICEYNPFHFGHNYQIHELRGLLGQDTVVVSIMSGAFTQRGEPAIFDKFLRARSAVGAFENAEKLDRTELFLPYYDDGFADLVIELPTPWSMSSAEFFARAGVSIARRIGVEYLVFGGESELSELQKTAENLSSDRFRSEFESARERDPSNSTNSIREKTYQSLYASPLCRGSNDILALEYLRALDESKIKPICIRRVGEKYNPDGIFLSETQIFSSASTIRKSIFCGNFTNNLIPLTAYEALKDAKPHRLSNLDQAVTAYLRFNHQNMAGVEIAGGIENKLHRAAWSSFGAERIISSAVERRFSASRIKRAIFGAMCGFEPSDYEATPQYAQLLAVNERGRKFLAENRKMLDGFILTKSASYQKLPEIAKKQFEANLRAEALWALSSDDTEDRRADQLLRRNPFII